MRLCACVVGATVVRWLLRRGYWYGKWRGYGNDVMWFGDVKRRGVGGGGGRRGV